MLLSPLSKITLPIRFLIVSLCLILAKAVVIKSFVISPTTSVWSASASAASRPSLQTSQIMMSTSPPNSSVQEKMEAHVKTVLFIECGFGNDQHGQTATKAAVRACRNAIEFNSIPSINRLVPGGYNALKLFVLLAVPPKYQQDIDLVQVAKVFPYGDVVFDIQDGGMVAPSGIAIAELGDKNQDMVVVCSSVTVGY